ncbi:MAG: FmdB family transcriptional regulator [Acidimicrobiia bacterium]|nr:FmdB family transcriptional regulator [Acidimicrobiia bacterium]
MPTYQYRCRDCGDDLEVVQKFSDDALTTCPSCEGSLKKVFSAVGISFKGSGFYKTDSRGSSSSTIPSGSSSSESSSSSTSSESSSSSTSSESASSSSASTSTTSTPAST